MARKNPWRHTFLVFVRIGGATLVIRRVILRRPRAVFVRSTRRPLLTPCQRQHCVQSRGVRRGRRPSRRSQGQLFAQSPPVHNGDLAGLEASSPPHSPARGNLSLKRVSLRGGLNELAEGAEAEDERCLRSESLSPPHSPAKGSTFFSQPPSKLSTWLDTKRLCHSHARTKPALGCGRGRALSGIHFMFSSATQGDVGLDRLCMPFCLECLDVSIM